MKKFGLSLLFAFMVLALFATAALAADPSPTPDPAPGYNDSDGLTPGQKGTSLENANNTGDGVDTAGNNFSTVIKNLSGHKTHTSYQNNTNSCASCHQTHTAKGDQLLFADGVYQTCTACHDGTLGFYNVFSDGSINPSTTAKMDGAGTFGGSHGSSMHLANDAVKISAAPGGNGSGTTKSGGYQWGENFNCASCHAPHGSYSDRLLQYNPNGVGSLPAEQGGNALVEVPVFDGLPSTTSDPEILVRSTVGTVVTIQQYSLKNGAYEVTKTPWLYGYGSRTDGNTYWSRMTVVGTPDDVGTPDVDETEYKAVASGTDKDVYFDYEHAKVYSTDAAGKVTGQNKLKSATFGYISRPTIVKIIANGYNSKQDAFWNGATVSGDGTVGTNHTSARLAELGYTVKDGKVTGLGVKMSGFCAACHTDYLQANSDGKQSHWGSESEAYRHSTNSDSYTCVRCHYGHGTDAYIMKDSLGRTIKDLVDGSIMNETDALSYMTDTNASSALKKYTNMSVCWACHNSSHAETIKNAERRDDHPTGMPVLNGVSQ